MLRNLRELYQYRALLWSLTERELRARYRASVLGFLWTFLNPTLHMAVYALIFGVFMKQGLPKYPYFMFVGLLPWIWFSSSLSASASAISDRRDLLTKVRFPAQVLPATVVTTNLINYLLSLPLMLLLGAFFGEAPSWHAVFLPAIVGPQLLFTIALCYFASALNVTFRDLQHIVQNVLMLMFFMTPVLYSTSSIPEPFRKMLVLGNPMAVLVVAYHDVFYRHQVPALAPLLSVTLLSVGLLWLACQLFEARREEFAESV